METERRERSHHIEPSSTCTFCAARSKRYEALAKALLASDNPVKAIASELGDHAGRLDALADRLHHVECVVGGGSAK